MSFAAESFKRYMKPMLPFTMVFLPYIFAGSNTKKRIISAVFIGVGAISIFLNWVSAQYGGHWALSHFDFKESKLSFIPELLKYGPSSSFLSTVSGVFGINSLILNLIGLLVLFLILFIVWRVDLMKFKNKIKSNFSSL